MPRVQCSFCGLPFTVRQVREGVDYFCCSGCAFASRIPVNEGQLPISPGLIAALVVAFGVFNEILFAALGGAVISEGRDLTGEKLLWVSVAIGGCLLVVLLTLLAIARPRRCSDGIAAISSLVLALAAIGRLHHLEVGAGTWLLFGANLMLVLWLARGWARRAWVRRRAGGNPDRG
ncbi:MAG TPA: hypothetical protein VGA56_26830 [Opitutaceae bacterium]